MSVAIFGLGRSGLAVAEALQALGKEAVVYDETPRERIAKPELIELAEKTGARLVLGEPFPLNLDTDYVVVNPAIDHRHAALQSLSQSGTEVISEVEFAYRISKAPVIAITGTNGKSTTTAMTVVALRAAGKDAILCGNIFGSGLDEQPLTSAALHSTEDQILVAEVSSFQLEWIPTFRPRAAAIVSLSPDHLDRYDSFEQYVETKYKIFRNQMPSDVAVTTDDNQSFESLARRKRILPDECRDSVPYGAFIAGSGEIPASEFRILGRHNLVNISIALTLARPFLDDAEMELAIRALKEFPGLANRMEFVAEKGGIRFINNSMCTNPAAVRASLESIDVPVRVLAGGVNKDLSFANLREFFAERPGGVYLFGRDAEQINRELGGNYPVWCTMKEAFDAATNEAKDGEIVMLAPGCASMDQFRDFRHRGDVFRTYVMDWTA